MDYINVNLVAFISLILASIVLFILTLKASMVKLRPASDPDIVIDIVFKSVKMLPAKVVIALSRFMSYCVSQLASVGARVRRK